MSEKELPLVTVAIAVFNGEATVERALKSATEQTYQRLQILISDDCSTDSTSSICKRFAATNGKIEYRKSETHLGMMNNYNLLLEMAQGDYFILFDQDDYRDSDFIEKGVEQLASTDVEVAIGRTNVMFMDNVMHINNFERIASRRSRIGRIYSLLRQPSDFLLYGLMRTESLRIADGWTLGTSTFYRLIFALTLKGKIKTIDSAYFYSAKGGIGRPTKRQELLRNGVNNSVSSFYGSGFLQIYQSYLKEVLRARLRFYQKVYFFGLVTLDFLFKLNLKFIIKLLIKFFHIRTHSKLESLLISLYYPLDNIVFLKDRQDDSLGYYRKNWPLV